MHVGINVLIEQQRGDPVCEVKAWLEKIGEADSKRNGFQDMAAECAGGPEKPPGSG